MLMSVQSLSVLLSPGDSVLGAGGPDLPPGLALVAGRTVLERQVRQALRVGADRILVLADSLPEALLPQLAKVPGVVLVPSRSALGPAVAALSGDLMLLAPGLVVDERLCDAVREADKPSCLLVCGEPGHAGASRLDSDRFWGGIARLPAGLAAQLLQGHPIDWEPFELLARGALAERADTLSIESLPQYDPRRRRDVPFLWALPALSGSAAANAALIASAQKGILDWPARFLHPPVENALVRLLWPTPITPNIVTGVTAIIGFVAMGLLAFGQLWPGLLLILLVGPLDGVDGKLARTRMEFSRWGDLEHVVDKVLEYGWFLALSLHFWMAGAGIAAWLTGIGISVFSLVEAVQGEFFRRFTGRQLDDWGPFERRVRLVAGRRNTYFWSLLPFAALGLWWEGFLFLLAYAALTFAIAYWRFLRALAEFGRAQSATVDANFTKTSYGFLPDADAKSS
jgi:phosphatidylglycerophosphate synthase